jgi:hypothetical protein
MNEAARFFAHWTRSEDTGIMEEPAVAAYMQEYIEPRRALDVTPGSWRAEKDLPAAGTHELAFHLSGGGVLGAALAEAPVAFDEIEHRATTGLANGYWSAGGISYYLPDDQRADEAYKRGIGFRNNDLGDCHGLSHHRQPDRLAKRQALLS